MPRRALSVTLLVLLAVPLLGAMAFVSVCPEPCPDDAEGSGCPPVCSLCASCTHARQAIVQSGTAAVALAPAAHVFPQPVFPPSSPLAADIFHVPLRG